MAEDKRYFFGIGGQNLQIKSGSHQTKIASLDQRVINEPELNNEMEISDSVGQITFGHFLDESNKILINYSEINDKPDDTAKSISFEMINFSYIHSFNNQGKQRGGYLGANLMQINTKLEETELMHENSLSENTISFEFGYEYLINKNFIFNIGTQIPVAIDISANSKNKKEMLYKKLPSNWDTKTDEYQQDRWHEYYTTDYYREEKTIQMTNVNLAIYFIF